MQKGPTISFIKEHRERKRMVEGKLIMPAHNMSTLTTYVDITKEAKQ